MIVVQSYGAFGSIITKTWTSTIHSIDVYCIVTRDDDLASLLVHSHAVHCTSCIFNSADGLTTATSRHHKLEKARCGGQVENRKARFFSEFECSNRLLRVMDRSLFCTPFMNEIASNDGNGAICKANGDLREIIKRCKCRYLTLVLVHYVPENVAFTHWKYLVTVSDSCFGQTGRQASLFDSFVQCPDLQVWFVCEIFLSFFSTCSTLNHVYHISTAERNRQKIIDPPTQISVAHCLQFVAVE